MPGMNMPQWLIYALLSALFAGLTSVIAKKGMSEISSELALTIRTGFVFLFVIVIASLTIRGNEWSRLKKSDAAWLLLSAAATTVSWVFYYRALQSGPVSSIASVDKASFLVAMLLGWLFLRETVSPRAVTGALLILIGLLITVTDRTAQKPPAEEPATSSATTTQSGN
jgi:transporter family protein